MCQSKSFRKQMRHKQEQKMAADGEAVEEGDGTIDKKALMIK